MTMSSMLTQQAVKTKTERVVRTFRPVQASSSTGSLPTRIELLKVGMWDTPNHGMFMITSDDLIQYKTNFDAGVAQAGDSGIMIDYDHNKGIAAGWIKGLEIGLDVNGNETLYADPVEWTGQGQIDLTAKNYKCISPEFYPGSRGGWEDPEQIGRYVPNVLTAAGLVNRPLFKGLQPIMASEDSDKSREDKNIIFVSASEKENISMTLEEVRAKDASVLSEEEKTFLVEHKDELNAEEQAKFGFEVSETTEAKAEREAAEAKAKEEADAAAAAQAKAVEDALQAARESAPDLANAQPVLASSIKGDEGKVVMAASEVKELYDYKTKLQKKEAEDFVTSQIARGAIKADQLNGTVEMLLASSGSHRSNLENMLKNLPDNVVLAGEMGSKDKASNAVSATEQIMLKANEAVSASSIDLGSAISRVRKENPELAKQADEENNKA